MAICGALIVLLAALAAVQYRWSARVAAADAQREREHLDTSASFFANRFNGMVIGAVEFMQNEARSALESHERVTNLPKLIGELYFVNIPAQGGPDVRRLGADGFFAASSLPAWFKSPLCVSMAIDQPPALVAPIYNIATAANTREAGRVQFLKTFRSLHNQCFVGQIDRKYLSGTLLPQLISQSFGPTAAKEYDFAVVGRTDRREPIYGAHLNADLRKPFFSMAPLPFSFAKARAAAPGPPHQMMYVQRVESTVIAKGSAAIPDLLGPGIWELDVAHKGVPLAVAFDQARQRDLLLSLLVEALLVSAIIFLVIAARRMQRLADQKMQFVAGVSHELRTPVSAISMLSRNQADGLVTGVEKVKQYGELIHQQSRRLNEMVEQTLQYAGIHSGLRRPARDEIDLRGLIEETVAARRDDLARAGFEIEIAIDAGLPPVSGDARLLRTAFDNLLSNAEKYAAAGRWIRVSAGYSAAQKEVRISVEDRGAGIDPADQAEIFEPFSRGRAAVDAQIPGSGLGLSLVRSAAEAHRGRVTLESEPGRGCNFTLRLPV